MGKARKPKIKKKNHENTIKKIKEIKTNSEILKKIKSNLK